MGKISDTSGSANIWLGSKQNSRQTILYVPAGGAEEPGLLYLEGVDGSGDIQDGIYLWADSASALRYSATYPTDENAAEVSGGGNVIGTTSGATVALDNLASVQIPDAGGLFALNNNKVDIGETGTEFKNAWFDGTVTTDDLESDACKVGRTHGTGDNYVQIASGGVLTTAGTSTINGMTVTNATNTIKFVKGDATLELAAGATDLIIGAAGSLDIAAAIDVDIDAALTIGTGGLTVGTGAVSFGTGAVAFAGSADYNQADGVTVDVDYDFAVSAASVDLDQDLGTGTSPTFVAVTTQGITNTTTAIDTTAAIAIGADNVFLTFGIDDATDSKIYFDGVGNLRFFDSNTSVAYTLQQLATGTTLNPTVTGDFTITDGNNTWSNTATNEAAVWTLAATATDAIQIVSANTTAAVLSITADATANGTLLYLDADGGVGSSGYFIECYDATDSPFLVGQGGALTMASTSNISNKISRNNVSGATPVLEIEETHAGGDVALLVDSAHTGAVDAMQITYAGTEYGLNITGANVAGGALYVAGPASQTAPLILVDGTTAATGWIGAATVGMIQIENNGDLANADSHLIQVDKTGETAASATGSSLHITDASTGGSTSGSAVYVSSAALDAVNIITTAVGAKQILCTGVTGQTADMVYLDATPTSGWIGAAGGGVLKIVGDGEIADADSSMLQINYSGQGDDSATGTCIRSMDSGTATGTQPSYANYFSSTNNDVAAFVTGSVGVANITANSYTNQTESMVILNGTTADWVGTDGNGMLEIHADGTFGHANASMIRMTKTGATAASMTGSCLHISDASTGGSTGGYAAYISASGASGVEALYVPDGKVAFKENLNITIDSAEGCDALTIDQNDNNGNKDGVVINTIGTGYALKVTSDSATNKGSHFIACQEQTTSVVTIDGTPGTSWDGADDVGMLHIKHDLALDNAGASLLYITSSAIKSDAEGGLARFVVTGATQTSACAVEIEVPTSTPALASNGIVKITGQDSPGAYLVQITANDDTGNKGAVDIHASGTDPALRVTGDQDDTPMASFVCAANTDVSGVLIDGDTAGWLGADAVGMLHLRNDIAGGHANATMLLIDKDANSVAEVNSAEGSCLRIVENMDVSAAPPAYAMYISCVDNEALHIDSGKVQIDEDVTIGVDTTGNAGHVDIWDGATSAPAYVMLAATDGTCNYLFVDNDDKLRIHTSIPTATSDGTVVGAQTA